MSQPYPDELTWWESFWQDVEARYAKAQHRLDRRRFRWFARTAYDIGAGLSAEQSASKHLRELEVELGIAPPIPPAPVLPRLIVEAED